MAELKPNEVSSEVPKQYFNGFNISFGNADFMLTLKLDNNEIFHFKTSYTVAKTLAEKMHFSVDVFEKIVGQQMLTTEAVLKAIQRSNEQEAVDKPAEPKKAE